MRYLSGNRVTVRDYMTCASNRLTTFVQPLLVDAKLQYARLTLFRCHSDTHRTTSRHEKPHVLCDILIQSRGSYFRVQLSRVET
jgi:hypothetical protein